MKRHSRTTPIRELKLNELRYVSGAGRDSCYYSYSSGSDEKFSSNSGGTGHR